MTLKLEPRETISTANVLTAGFQTKITHPIEIYDNTLREGEQPPGVVFTADDKFEIAQLLDALGVHWATVGFPAVSSEEFKAVQRIAKAGFHMKLGGLSRMLQNDIAATVDSGVHMVALFLGGSDTHLFDKLRMTEADAFAKIESMVRMCKDRGVMCSFAVEDASRTPLPRLLRMSQIAVEAGADYIIIPDTCGVLTPSTTFRLFETLRAYFPKTRLGTHFHDDLGLAHANTLMAAEAGATALQVTANGAGERAGNTCLEEIVIALKLKYGLDLGLKYEVLTPLCERVHRASGTQPAEHKSITGKWCFTHESGIHVAGVLANRECYQPYPPELVGRYHEIVLGKHSGIQSIHWIAERAGIAATDETKKAVLEKVKKHAEQKAGLVTEEQVLGWLRAPS